MSKTISKIIWVPSILCLAMISLMLPYPMTCYGEEESCDYEISVNVAANIINITSQGEGHSVVVHTLQHFTIVNREETQVFVNDGENEDCKIVNFGQREDDNGHLDIYFLIDELQNCADYLEIDYESNILRIAGVETEKAGEETFCGESDMHIVGMQGPGKR